MKERLVNFVNQREARFSSEDAHSNFHSRAYHRFFEDYAERQQPDAEGRLRIERTYIGLYYCQNVSRKKAVWLRVEYGLLWIIAAAAFVLAATRPVGSNRSVYVTCFQALTVMGLFWELVALFRYVVSPEKMTVYEYKASSKALQHAAALTGLSSFLAAGASIVWLLLRRPESSGSTGVCFCGFLLCGVFSALLKETEKRIPYTQEASGNRPDETSSLID